MKRKGVPAQIRLAIAMLLVAAIIAAYCTPQEDPQPLQPADPPPQEETTSAPPCEETLPDTGGVRA